MRSLVWQGFLGICVRIVVDDGIISDAIELGKAMQEGKTDSELAVIEQQQEIKFEKTLNYKLMKDPYMVWRRLGKEKYNKHAPQKKRRLSFWI